MNNISTPTFTGNFIGNAKVLRKVSNEKFVPCELPVVEMNPFDEKDLHALKNISNVWEGCLFAKSAYLRALSIFETIPEKINQRFFILTKQKNNFENINAEDILAESRVYIFDKPKVDIRSFEVDPAQNHWSMPEYKNYNNLGTGFLNKLKEIFKGKLITLDSLSSSKEFYLKNGFKNVSKNSSNMYYRA